jgi:hypothetical protein
MWFKTKSKSKRNCINEIEEYNHKMIELYLVKYCLFGNHVQGACAIANESYNFPNNEYS